MSLNVWRLGLKDKPGIIRLHNLRERFPKWMSGYSKNCGGGPNGGIVLLKGPNRNVLVLKVGVLVLLIKREKNLY